MMVLLCIFLEVDLRTHVSQDGTLLQAQTVKSNIDHIKNLIEQKKIMKNGACKTAEIDHFPVIIFNLSL